ncbi:MAG: hypothetical protein Q8Q88_09050 [Phenylobacterium sp.]|uniref:hypothetical protein n=1 Tax=Phenylobacterium sp. TaxID=1871053 RepID=UPI002734DB74|nr:hypothetical protein [Phenylobacterium sp.]MDP3747180.1 hypothetical protein [Phenylobacterium sp.]
MNPNQPTPPRRMGAAVELALRALGLAAILGALLVGEGPGRWLAVGGGLWLAGIYLYRAATERPGPIGRHLFWAVVFIALAAWLGTRT